MSKEAVSVERGAPRKIDTRLIEHRRVPYAVGASGRLVSPEQALYGSGAMKYPQCGGRVALTSVAASLAFAHVRPVPSCALSRRGKAWVKPSAVLALYAFLREAVDAPPASEAPLLRKCYTCFSPRPDSLPGGGCTVVREYDPMSETGVLKPDITVLGKNGNPTSAFFVSAEDPIAVPERMRRFPSMVVNAEDALLASGPLRVAKVYGMPSPPCPCDSADRIRAEGNPPNVECPKTEATAAQRTVSVEFCRGCPYHLAEYRSEITCGFRKGIRRRFRKEAVRGGHPVV